MIAIIYGVTEERAYSQMQKIITHYKQYYECDIFNSSKMRSEWRVRFKNDDYWIAMKYNESRTHGRRANIVYIDTLLEGEAELNCKLVACAPPYCGISYFSNGESKYEILDN